MRNEDKETSGQDTGRRAMSNFVLMSDSSEKEAPCANAGRVRKGWCKTDGKHSESQSATNCYLQPGAAGEVETKVQIAYGKEGTEGGGFGDGKGPL